MPLWVKIAWTIALIANILAAISGASPTWSSTLLPLGSLVVLIWTVEFDNNDNDNTAI